MSFFQPIQKAIIRQSIKFISCNRTTDVVSVDSYLMRPTCHGSDSNQTSFVQVFEKMKVSRAWSPFELNPLLDPDRTFWIRTYRHGHNNIICRQAVFKYGFVKFTGLLFSEHFCHFLGSLFLFCKKDDSAGFPVQAMEGEEFFPAVLFFCEIDQGVFVILPGRAGRKISRFVESYQEIVFKNLVKAAVNLGLKKIRPQIENFLMIFQ